MSVSEKPIYQIIRRARDGVAVIAAVKDGDGASAQVRETKDPRMMLGAVGSFWQVTGEKKEPKLALENGDVATSNRSWRPPQLIVPIRASSQFELPATVEQFLDPGRHEARSFSSAVQLSVGYSPRDKDFEGTVALLRTGNLPIPETATITAIEVRSGAWVTSQISRRKADLYGFEPGASTRSITVSGIANRVETIKLPNGLVVFATQPNWSVGEAIDLRSPSEIVEAAEMWLSRARQAVASAPGSEDDLAEGLRKHLASTIEANEKADLIASIKLLANREPLLDILPQIMLREPLLQERLKAFEHEERDRVRNSTRAKLDAELKEEQLRLTAIKNELAEAENRLSLVTHREALLRVESERHDENIRERVAEAARQITEASQTQSRDIRAEVEKLKELIADMARTTPAPEASSSADVGNPRTDQGPSPELVEVEVARRVEMVTDEGRSGIIAALRQASGLSAGYVAGIVAHATDGIPVLIGTKASALAADLATAIGGDDAAVVFCDPTRISWQDLLQDESSGLAAAVSRARANPETLTPVAVCNITSGPCEYWIPQFMESRRIGRIPRNLVIFASAGVDGMRISMPDSILHHLMPVLVPAAAKPVRKLYSGPWPSGVNLDRTRLAEAREFLSDQGGLEGMALDRGSRTLSRMPATIVMAEAAELFIQNAQWLKALAADGKHEFNQYFKNIEG
ncbi:hypothetical protein HGO34_15180 [Agrobacterium vitis]|uniref:Uncharacterized protein n=1 Tax=Agrobacterium vitis TaxID=373 RepID=A0AAE5AWS7_AGRVI|nr:hypothetical protein [Agrobacterium vitis]MCF1499032.1 hypothetical protein [Allorhizobium sp. Av2]MCM2441062.1 hypothetical protein [Agrobacterium vitis]MUZ58480.1 hypothetical protein [Agrobacterium vitis]MVA65826.1 hypothetical protein [Agrobacterium vitis]MVA88152.1 hypothetical protein [Agrobacterium vitis]